MTTKRKRLALLAVSAAVIIIWTDITGVTFMPVPWETGCAVLDRTFPFVHFIECPAPQPAPAPTPNPNPPVCQDCVSK